MTHPHANPGDALAFRTHLGSVALNFAATLGMRQTADTLERLLSARRLGEWFVELGVLTDKPHVSAAQLAAAIDLGEAIYRCTSAAARGDAWSEDDVATINRFASALPVVARLEPDGSVTRSAPQPTNAALSSVARDAIELVGNHRGELGICESERCSAVFADTSRGRRRRWCSMERCGNRAKAAAFRKRGG